MNIKLCLLETQQKTTMPGYKQGIYKGKKKLNVSNAFRAENIKNYLGQWSSTTSNTFIIETVKWGLKIDFINKLINKHFPQMGHSTGKSEINSREIEN